MYEYEDYYDNFSEFDRQIDEFKQSLITAVKEEHAAELDRLRKENAALQTVKRDFEQIQQEYRDKERQLERERKELAQTVRRERLGALMQDFQVTMWQPRHTTVRSPKCDKCDKYHDVEYTTPLGKKAKEKCSCYDGKTVYVPAECVCTEFKINERDNKTLLIWYRMCEENTYDYAEHSSSHYAECVYDGSLKYEDMKQYETYFKTAEECQGYCDWLTEKAASNVNK